MKIEKIYIACYKGDFHLTKICVASIRYWYPDIPIFLIKDYLKGNFRTEELEKKWNVSVFHSSINKFGWGLSKLEPYFIKEKERVLIIDSDIVFLGRVLDKLNVFDDDFVLSGEFIADIKQDWVKRTYFDYEKLKKFNPAFKCNNYLFNTGQILAFSGIFKREDFKDVIDYQTVPPKILHTEFLACADQGILNYKLPLKEQNKELSIRTEKFHVWPCREGAEYIDLSKILSKEGYPFLIHWAGCAKSCIFFMKRYDILDFFERNYFEVLNFGIPRLYLTRLKRRIFYKLRIIKKKLFDYIKLNIDDKIFDIFR